MTTAEEEFIHYVECINSLNCAWHILGELDVVKQPTAIHAAAFRFALIEYAKPYTRSDGKHKHGRNPYLLPTPNLPEEYLTLHHQILTLRHKFLAHTDLTLKEAQLQVSSRTNQNIVTISSNGSPSLPDGKAVITLIERTLDQMYVEHERLKESLASNI